MPSIRCRRRVLDGLRPARGRNCHCRSGWYYYIGPDIIYASPNHRFDTRNPYLVIGNRNGAPRHDGQTRRASRTTTAYGPVKPPRSFHTTVGLGWISRSPSRIMPETKLGITSEFPFRIPRAPAAPLRRIHRPTDSDRYPEVGFVVVFGGCENYGGRSGLNVWKYAPISYYYVLLSRKNRQTGREASMVWQRPPHTVIQL